MPRFNSYELRKWSISVRRRDKVCQVCGSREKLQAHHINDKSYHPEQAYDINNGIALCGNNKKTGNRCHQTFHTTYMGGFRRKCTFDDWNKFMALFAWVKSHKPIPKSKWKKK